MCNRARTPPQAPLVPITSQLNISTNTNTNMQTQPPTIPQLVSPIAHISNMNQTNTNHTTSNTNNTNYWQRDYDKRREMMEVEYEKYDTNNANMSTNISTGLDIDIENYSISSKKSNSTMSTANNSIDDVTLHAQCIDHEHTQHTHDTNDTTLKKSSSTAKLLDWILMRN